jgi:penicillin amidase
MKKSLKIISVILIFGFAFSIGGIYHLFKRTVPYGSGKLNIPTLSAEVKVTRDVEGIPHIEAKNKLDAYRALGYVMASERLFQMEILRRLGSGTLSEILGEKGVKIDKTFRTIGVRRFFKEKLNQGMINKEMLSEVNAFFEGVNFFVKEGTTPAEFILAGIPKKEFSVLDSYSVIGYFSYAFAAFFRHDLLMEKLKGKIPEVMWKELQIDASANSVMTAKVDGNLDGIFNVFEDVSLAFYAIEGSNAWAVSKKRSKSGAPILASDPHVSLSNPGIWFEAHLKVKDPSDPFEIYGHFIPGIPFAAMSHNQKRGWGITISYFDDMDFFKEEMIEDGNQYLFDGQRKDVRRFSEIISVKDQEDIHLPIRMTEHGPLLDEIIEEKSIALNWSFHHISNRPLEAFWKMNEAKNFEAFKKAASLAAAPGLNIIYADAEDNIARLNVGKYPLRAIGTDGMSVLSGRGDQEYRGYIPFDEMPHEINPKSGIVLSSNNRPLSASTKFSGLWQPRDRFITLYSKLHSKEKWDVKEFMELQNNIENPENEWMKRILIENIDTRGFSEVEAASLELLRTWKGKSKADSAGASIYYEMLFHVTMNSLDELDKEDRLKFCGLSARWFYLQRILKREQSPWWNISSTEKEETKRDIITKSFKDTVSSLSKMIGTDPSKWKWGLLHKVEFVHAFGRVSPLDKVFNIGPMPIDGAYNEVNNLRMVGCKDGHKVKAGPSTRRVVDFSDPSKSFGILPLGNSGHKFSPHYKNQLSRYKEGKYRLQIMSDELLEKYTQGVLILTP